MGNAALTDASATDDPFVARIQDGGEILVRQYHRRQAFAPAGDRCVFHERAAYQRPLPRAVSTSLTSLCGTALATARCPTGQSKAAGRAFMINSEVIYET